MSTSKHLDHIDEARNQVTQFLKSDTERVLVIRGSYGAGKSYFLRDDYLKNNHSPPEAPKWLAYTSVFGIGSIKELQQAIAGNIEGRRDNKITHGRFQKAANLDMGLNILQKVAKPFIGGVNIELSASSLIWAIAKRAGMLLVVDDIDRNSGSLKLNDLIGFISSLTENSGGKTKAILLLHDNELDDKDKDLWAKLREKTVDREITFAPNISDTVSHYVKSKSLVGPIASAHNALQSRNIRSILKLESLVSRILKYFKTHDVTLNKEEERELVYTATLFLQSGIDFSPSDLQMASRVHFYPGNKTLDGKQKTLLQKVEKLDFYSSETFTELCLEFFKSGSIDHSKLESFKSDKQQRDLKEAQDRFWRNFWKPFNSDFNDNHEEIVQNINEAFEKHIELMPPHTAAKIIKFAKDLELETDHYFKQWAQYYSHDLKMISKLADASPLFPNHLRPEPKAPHVKEETLERMFLHALKDFNRDDSKFFSDELRSSLKNWETKDYEAFILKSRDPDLLISIRTLLRINFSDSGFDDMLEMVARIKVALKNIKTSNKLNALRVDTLFSEYL